MKFKSCLIIFLIVSVLGCKTQQFTSNYESDQLKVEQLTENTFRHISYLATESYGKVACNGMIVIDNNEAIVFDTPTNDSDAKELIDWITNTLKCKPIGIVVTHFHVDCLGGLNEFHQRKIPSYASLKTIELAKASNSQIPQKGFDNYLEVKVGTKKVINEFLGAGHTIDNVVSYFPNEKVLFGGCLIKKMNASKGYLGDANISEWSNTVKAVKSKYGDAKVIIPGHGKPGDIKLLDYTIELFKTE